MNSYALRKNFTAFSSEKGKTIRGKLAFKTKHMDWLDTESPVIILISIHSAFHDGVNGDLKMNALISTIKNHCKGKITILLTDRAHLRVASLKYNNNIEQTLDECIKSAQALNKRYTPYFEGCEVVYWHSYISQDKNFADYLQIIKDLYLKDSDFHRHVNNDLHVKCTDCPLYKENGIQDLLEQCACIMILADKGYRFQFYPGKPNDSTEYVNQVILPAEKQVTWINVFLAIEKKTVME